MLTSNKLINKVLRRCYWPTDGTSGLGLNAPLSDADLLELADEEIAGQLWPQIVDAEADYAISTLDYPIAAGQTLYRLPPNAYGPIKDIVEVQTDSDATELSMTIFKLEDLARPERLQLRLRTSYLACVDGDYLRLFPPPTITDGKTLRIKYYRAPSKLALTAGARQVAESIQSVVLGIPITDITLTANRSGALTGNIDVISAGNAHQLIVDNAIALSAGTADVSINTNDVFRLPLANDWVADAGFTPVAQIPDFMESLLVLRVSAAALRAKGDRAAAQIEEQLAAQRSEQAEALLTPRVTAEPDYVITRNSVLRSSALRRRVWG